ncbi:receptor-like kinase TMK3 [Euphorbia lathyris]|uniref:receptor-like kinase TMK3 n=1 Tax=Euphorbia lathyris TaxID=212925 RepID=UPI00331404C9
MADNFEFCGVFLLCLIRLASSVTDPNDFKVLMDFKDGLDNSELLKWPSTGNDPCGPPSWPHVFCSNARITQIQVQKLGLKGSLPPNFNQLSKLYNLGFQNNGFYGKLPSFKGLSELEFAFLDFNQFDTIPSDFFYGLSSIRVLALDENPLNKTTGWSLPNDLANSVQLTNLSCSGCNLIGPLPDFLGSLSSLNALRLSYNRLSGEIPASFEQSSVTVLWLNNQEGGGLTGTIDVIAKMTSLRQVWLQGNSFTGIIPENIGDLSLLKELDLNGNKLVGLIPQALADMELNSLDLNNNLFMGSIPMSKAGKFSYDSNLFCQSKPGVSCASEVYALIDFLGGLNYPLNVVSQWSGNDPCQGPWVGLNCDSKSKVSIISLPRRNLTGTLSPSIAKLDSLTKIILSRNSISGSIPKNLTDLKSLTLLDISGNNLSPPLPKFQKSMKLVIDGNPLLVSNPSQTPPSPVSPPNSPPSGITQSPPPLTAPPSPNVSSKRNSSDPVTPVPYPSLSKKSGKNKLIIVIGIIVGSVIILAVIALAIYSRKRKDMPEPPSSIVVHPRDPFDSEKVVKIAIGSLSAKTATSSSSNSTSMMENSHLIESRNLIISVQVLRKVTKNFASENKLGHGGFGTVYKGELDDGTKIAVKRMDSGVTSSKALDEFQAEIAVLSKVRHRHLVSLLGYAIEGNERLLVYEYMPQGSLNKHLFEWKKLDLEPMSWTRRLIIALDVARGMEYLHSMARETFIHRDLKSANILLDDVFHAKISDFGLVKLAPDGERSIVTRLAGTFGYLAPEYAVMGKITTKSDVFSFGVVLMELLTGLAALDEQRSEESRYLAEWFWRIKSSKEKLMAAVDPTLGVNDETFDSISIVAELAGHCTARDPNHRPEMGHAVSVLGLLVERWKPIKDESNDVGGIDYSLPLPQMLKVWQNSDSTGISNASSSDSKDSIPARPAGFADSFTSCDGR